MDRQGRLTYKSSYLNASHCPANKAFKAPLHNNEVINKGKTKMENESSIVFEVFLDRCS